MTSLGDYTFLQKPMRPGRISSPNAQNVYKHSTESAASYSWTTEKLDFLLEFMKFIPKFEQLAYKGGQGVDNTAYNDALDDYGSTKSIVVNGVTMQEACFGMQHRMNDASGGDYTFWGAGEGQYDENLEFSPGAAEWNHILASVQPKKATSPKAPDGRTGAADVDNGSYDHIKFCENMRDKYAPDSDEYKYWVRLINNDSNLPQWVWEGIQGTFGSDTRSYYQIIMDSFVGVDGTKDANGDKTSDIYCANGSYYLNYDSYKADTSDAGNASAFYLMASMLESRNRAWDAMTEIFGPLYDTWSMGSKESDSAMIKDYEAWYNDPKRGGGADPHNIKIFSMFLEMQHSITNMMTAFNSGIVDWFTACKDQVVFKNFYSDLQSKTQAYLDKLKSQYGETSTEYLQAKAVRDAWYAPDTTYRDAATYKSGCSYSVIYPYPISAGAVSLSYVGSNSNRETTSIYRAWDRAYNSYDNPNMDIYYPPDPKNPLTARNHMHRFMTRWHANGMEMSWFTSPSRSDDKRYSYDWVVHDVGRSFECWCREVGRVVAINVVNRSASRNYQEKMEKYIEEKDQKKLDEIQDLKMRARILAERKASENKMVQSRRRRDDDFKRTVAYSMKAKINDNIAAKRAKGNKAQPKKKG